MNSAEELPSHRLSLGLVVGQNAPEALRHVEVSR
jgi:hypothetical protein